MAGLKNSRWWTLANGLTSLRLVVAWPLYHSIDTGTWWVACALFWFAVATDLIDGPVARARDESSALGGLLDHSCDAILVTSGLLALSNSGEVPVVLPYLVGAAFLQYVLDSKALAGQPLRASALGRWNGVFYFFPIGIIVTRESLGLELSGVDLVLFIGWALVASTLISMSDRAYALFKTQLKARH